MKTIFITGAGAGIGRATAERFHAAGWAVGLTDVDESGLADLAASLGGERVWVRRLNVVDDADVALALGEFAKAHGDCIDVLFNCAGILRTGAFADIPLQEHQRIVDINVTGLINVTHHAHSWLKSSQIAKVINMSSASAVYGVPDFASYSASKFAVRGLTEALNIEWSRDGIDVVDIMPPFVKTAMVAANASLLIDRMGVNLSATDIADAVWRAANDRRAPVHNPVGWQFRAVMLMNKLFPSRATRQALNFLSH
jgi:NAD(P)-dependent dehydrogenase (short-subunit alcohol dehydrogenase family)